MEFIWLLIAFFSLNTTPDELTETQIADYTEQYEAQTASMTDSGTIRREIQVQRYLY